ncbi:MAG: hypothetical protein KGJ86_13610, partial [Chloroflexota bacterium]|nr:hypothetical protein [Chloroflexota bacterium]
VAAVPDGRPEIDSAPGQTLGQTVPALLPGDDDGGVPRLQGSAGEVGETIEQRRWGVVELDGVPYRWSGVRQGRRS